MNKRIIFQLVFLSFIFLAGFILFYFRSASAEEPIWTFQVPVEVKNMPENVKEISIYLYICSTSKPSKNSIEATNNLITEASKAKKLDSEGNFSEVLTFNIYPSNIKKDWKKAKSYYVELVFPANLGSPGPENEKVKARPGTTPVTVAKGIIPVMKIAKEKK